MVREVCHFVIIDGLCLFFPITNMSAYIITYGDIYGYIMLYLYHRFSGYIYISKYLQI